MAKDVIMPALGMAQETGTLLQWFKSPGDSVSKGELLMEIETDKATVEIEAPADGILSNVTAQPGDVIPVGERIALILAPGETESETPLQSRPLLASPPKSASTPVSVSATPVATRLAAEHNLDIAEIKPNGGQIRKEDVLAYLDNQSKPIALTRILASPKARRLAQERGLDLGTILGSGPDGAVLVADLPISEVQSPITDAHFPTSRIWSIMAERVTQAWTTIPHFYLIREVNVARLVAWRERVQNNSPEKITYTDLLVRLIAVALQTHPRLNASWKDENVVLNPEINIGLAVAVEDGLIVPVIHRADELNLAQLAARRIEIVERAKAGKATLNDLSGGTFTISNLGMFGVDAFNAIVNPPQAAILAVSRIADRVAPLNGQPTVQPMLTLTLSCDHRAVDGARGAQFLQALADLIEEPLQLLN